MNYPVILSNEKQLCGKCNYDINNYGNIKECPFCMAGLNWDLKINLGLREYKKIN